MKWLLYILLFCLSAGMLCRCANPVALIGGAKDETPPKVVNDGMLPANMQTNFTKQDIVFTFDEWVKLNDAINQIVVSPPLEKQPKVVLKNKEMTFKFDEDEVLKEEVTYTINFGEAIKDLTEGNPADLKYVFSTGDFIDSLTVAGVVTDALTKNPVKDCLVMLYQNLSDTIVRTGKPYYFSKTNEQGRFQIGNVKAGSFKVFALHEDQGQRYFFDSDSEGIGFLDAPIQVSDSTGQNIKLEIFKEEVPLKLVNEKLVEYGHAWFSFSREPYDLQISHEEKNQNLRYDYRTDTVHIWYDTEEQFLVYLAQDTFWTDTIKIKTLPRADFIKDKKLTVTNGHLGIKKMNKKSGIALRFSQPIATLNNNFLSLYADTTETLVPATMQKDTGMFLVNINTDWAVNVPYELVLLPGAVTDMFGIQNDTIIFSYAVQSSEEYGKIKVEIVDLGVDSSYIIKLFTKSNKEIERYIVSGENSFSFELDYMVAGDYMVEITLDSNNNKKWDTGNYDLKTYPEKKFTQDLETLRANWTVEVSISPTFSEQ